MTVDRRICCDSLISQYHAQGCPFFTAGELLDDRDPPPNYHGTSRAAEALAGRAERQELRDRDVHESMDGRWEFNAEVTRVFEEMLERSIPQYQIMRRAVYDVGSAFVSGHAVVDLGCSRGDALAPFVEHCANRADAFIGFEVSEPMRMAAQERFADRTDVIISDHDLRDGIPYLSASLVLSVLTLMFIPVNYRAEILQHAYERLTHGGAMILVEKVLGASSRVDDVLVGVYHDWKHLAGYSREEIERKRLALEGVLVPLTAEWNEGMLARAGFVDVDCFWAALNFRAWVAVKR